MNINTLADLKRALAVPGVVVKMLEHSREEIWKPERLAEAKAGRTVKKLQGNAFVLNATFTKGGSWMHYGKAADWRFDGTDRATYQADSLRIVYQLCAPLT